MVRIINPFVPKSERKQLKPVLLHHGFQCSGTIWLIAAEGKLDSRGNYIEYSNDDNYFVNNTVQTANSLGFVLASRGYDVWLANYRGSVYSTNHTRYSVDSEEYWQFSMDEMIRYDLPAEIDYVKWRTNHSTISYVGHSQGNLMMLALMTINDHYSKVIKPFVALSPVFYEVAMPAPLATLSYLRNVFRDNPMMIPFSRQTHMFIANICQNVYIREICYAISYRFFGFQRQNVLIDRIPVYLAAVPMGSSSWNVAHLFQLFASEDRVPKHFDFGLEKNLKKYGSINPPIYDASRINSTDIALFYTSDDWFNKMNSIEMLKSDLKGKDFVLN